jgi:hypothetical protein
VFFGALSPRLSRFELIPGAGTGLSLALVSDIVHLYYIPSQDSGVLSIISEFFIIRLSLTCHSSLSGSILQTQFTWSGSSAAAFPPRDI